jgi:hypothetical protein
MNKPKMGAATLRAWCAVGATILVVGVAMVVVAVSVWHPLSEAPAVWWVGGGLILAGGLVVTILATSALARLSRE